VRGEGALQSTSKGTDEEKFQKAPGKRIEVEVEMYERGLDSGISKLGFQAWGGWSREGEYGVD